METCSNCNEKTDTVYDFSINILHNNRIDLDIILFSEEYVNDKGD